MEKLRDKPENRDLDEFVSLVAEWREGKTSKSKCPYCVNPIEKQATKCSSCLSEVEWFKFDGLYGPCKAGASEEMELSLMMARGIYQAALEAQKEALEAEKEALRGKEEKAALLKIAELENAKCMKCDGLVFSGEELKNITKSGNPSAFNFLEYSRRYNLEQYRCEVCQDSAEKRAAMILDAVAIFILCVISILIIIILLH